MVISDKKTIVEFSGKELQIIFDCLLRYSPGMARPYPTWPISEKDHFDLLKKISAIHFEVNQANEKQYLVDEKIKR